MDTNGLGGIVAFILGWFLAQSGKLIGDRIQAKRRLTPTEVLNAFIRSGGMPSGHTASFIGLTIYLGLTYGFLSSIFALAACTTVIVIYDAVNVRYAVGEQGKLLNIIAEGESKKYKKLRIVEGHTIPQVIVGGLIGIGVGILAFLIF